MKRIISVLLCFCMIFAIGVFSVSAAENYCDLFNSQWGGLAFVSKFGNETEPWSANDIAFMTSCNLKNIDSFLNSEKSDEVHTYYSVPKADFEDLANKLFDINVDLTTANYSGMRDVKFDEEAQKYDVILKPAGGGAHYNILGYLENGSKYTVYMQFVDYAEAQDLYIKCEGTVTGGYAKLLSCEYATSIPKEEDLITPLDNEQGNSSQEATSSEDSTSSKEDTTSSGSGEPVLLGKTDGVQLEGNKDAFAEDEKLKIKVIEDVTSFTTIVADISEKFIAYEFSPVTVKGEFTATFTIPKEYEPENVVILKVKDGAYEVLRFTLNTNENTVSAKIKELGTYLLAEKKGIKGPDDESKIESGSDTDVDVSSKGEGKKENKNDEEDGSVWPRIIAIIVALALIGGAATWYVLKYKKEWFKK